MCRGGEVGVRTSERNTVLKEWLLMSGDLDCKDGP